MDHHRGTEAGPGRGGGKSAAAATSPPTAVTRANDAKWSSSDLTTVFHVACNSAESSTSPATAGPIAQVGGQACASASRPAPACTATSRRSGSTRRALAHSISAASSATRPRRLSARVCFPTISARR